MLRTLVSLLAIQYMYETYAPKNFYIIQHGLPISQMPIKQPEQPFKAPLNPPHIITPTILPRDDEHNSTTISTISSEGEEFNNALSPRDDEHNSTPISNIFSEDEEFYNAPSPHNDEENSFDQQATLNALNQTNENIITMINQINLVQPKKRINSIVRKEGYQSALTNLQRSAQINDIQISNFQNFDEFISLLHNLKTELEAPNQHERILNLWKHLAKFLVEVLRSITEIAKVYKSDYNKLSDQHQEFVDYIQETRPNRDFLPDIENAIVDINEDIVSITHEEPFPEANEESFHEFKNLLSKITPPNNLQISEAIYCLTIISNISIAEIKDKLELLSNFSLEELSTYIQLPENSQSNINEYRKQTIDDLCIKLCSYLIDILKKRHDLVTKYQENYNILINTYKTTLQNIFTAEREFAHQHHIDINAIPNITEAFTGR